MACFRMVNMQGANPCSIANNNSHPVFSVTLSSNPTGIQRIICNSDVKVIVQLLAIEEVFHHNHTHVCIYEKIKKEQVCVIDPKKIAHIHITTTNPNALIKHYIITFVDGKKSEEHNELIKLLYNTELFENSE